MPERPLLDIARVEITDDLGERRVLPFIDVMGPARGYPNSPEPEAMWKLRKTILFRNYLPGALLGMAVTLVAGLALGSLLFVPSLQKSTLLFILAALAMMLPLAVLYEVLALPVFRRMYRPAYLEGTLGQGLCGFCLYDLSRAEPDAQGRVVCPECRGTWNAARLPADIRPRA